MFQDLSYIFFYAKGVVLRDKGTQNVWLEAKLFFLILDRVKPGTHYEFFSFNPAGWTKKTVSSGQIYPVELLCSDRGKAPLQNTLISALWHWLRALIGSKSTAGFPACSSDRSWPNDWLLSTGWHTHWPNVGRCFLNHLISPDIQPVNTGLKVDVNPKKKKNFFFLISYCRV